MLFLETLLLMLSLSLLLPCFAISSSDSTRKLPVSLRAALGRGREGSFSTNITSYLIITTINYTTTQIRASDISRKKKQNFAGFSGANSRKNWPISRDFRGKKIKIRGTIGRFRATFAGKVKIRRKIGPFRGILAEKSQFSKDFQGQILRKIGRFHGKFRGETFSRNNQ